MENWHLYCVEFSNLWIFCVFAFTYIFLFILSVLYNFQPKSCAHFVDLYPKYLILREAIIYSVVCLIFMSMYLLVYLCMLSHVQLCDPMGCSLPGSSTHGIFQARILEWVAISSPGDLPDSGIKPSSLASCIGRQILNRCTTWEAHLLVVYGNNNWFLYLSCILQPCCLHLLWEFCYSDNCVICK